VGLLVDDLVPLTAAVKNATNFHLWMILSLWNYAAGEPGGGVSGGGARGRWLSFAKVVDISEGSGGYFIRRRPSPL
jgi:hypothetical protein